MIKKISVLFLLFLATGSVFGQNALKFGVFFDPVITWLRSDVSDVTRSKARMGFDFGVVTDYYFAPNYALHSGISLFNMGGTLNYANGITLRAKDNDIKIEAGGDVKYKIQYLKLPIAVKFKTHMIGRVIYSANVGFDPMIRVSARANYDDVKNVKVNKEIKTFNLGYHIGVGGQYSLGEDASIFGGITFMNTFTDITKPAHDRITSNNLVFRIGVMF